METASYKVCPERERRAKSYKLRHGEGHACPMIYYGPVFLRRGEAPPSTNVDTWFDVSRLTLLLPTI